MKNKPKIQLVGLEGNAFAILARARRILKEAKYSQKKIDLYLKEATSGDYNKLLNTTTKWFEVY